jgi:hypothetical protein
VAADRKDIVVAAVNDLLSRAEFCRSSDFGTLTEEDEAYARLQLNPQGLSEHQIERRNRLLLERIWPDVIARSGRPPQTVKGFFEEEVESYLRSEFPSLGLAVSRIGPGADPPELLPTGADPGKSG